MATENQLYKSRAQRDNEYERFCDRKKHKSQAKLEVEFIITVLDETPDKIIFGMVDEWEQPFDLDEPNKALLERVNNHIFSTYEGELLNNATLIRIGYEVDKFMREHYPNRYTGRVRMRRGEKNGEEYFYRYIAS